MSAVSYGMVVDTRTCVACAACVIACKTENDVAEGFSRDWIFTATSGSFPNLAMEIRSERCNHCEDAPCVSVCPTGASHYGPGGTVQVTESKCTGCKACIAACPYDARFIDPR
ncbi:MAG: 4Fe-4S dicluster domain-containing protein, partial [Gemmatimonadetes bacterium]|nr:4Fe-4S dicluster domain-containing protein [Gemmatimonadota bacterium]